MNKGNHTITCRNCKTKVAKTPNKICIKCSIPSWGYSSIELVKINNPHNQIVQKFVCKNCDNTVVRTPIDKCHVCSMPNWGYTKFELNNSLVKVVESVSERISKNSSKSGFKQSSQIPVIASIGVILFAGLMFFIIPDFDNEEVEDAVIEGADTHKTLNPESFASTIDEIQKAVVFIKTNQGTGTGFLISDKYILTAGHVACGTNRFEITFTKNRNQKKRGKLVTCALISSRTNFDFFERDFALIEIPPVRNIKPLKLGNSSDVTEMDDVFTAGHSFGDINLSMTEGDISRLKFGDERFDLFSHTIASNPGNSGGPIINVETNEVIAILVGGRGPMLTQTELIIPQGENIGVKINNVKNALSEYINENE